MALVHWLPVHPKRVSGDEINSSKKYDTQTLIPDGEVGAMT